jgi:hypothetical protein
MHKDTQDGLCILGMFLAYKDNINYVIHTYMHMRAHFVLSNDYVF